MATIVNEQVVSGRKFRKLIDEASRLWLRISFWTKACDVEFEDGETAETKFANIAKTISDLATSFRDGVNKIFNKLKGLGFTPSPNSPDGICNAIQNVYDKRYADGRTQGREDVIDNPSEYGVNVSPYYFNCISGSNISFTCPKNGTYHVSLIQKTQNDNSHNNASNIVILRVNNVEVYKYDYHWNNNNWVEDCYGDKNYVGTLTAGSVISLDVSENYISDNDCIYTFCAICIY